MEQLIEKYRIKLETLNDIIHNKKSNVGDIQRAEVAKRFIKGFINDLMQLKAKIGEEKLFTESELLEVLDLGMTLRQNQLAGEDDRSGVELLGEWIKEKQK